MHGARENNLKNVSLEIPKRRRTVFTGVSGSGNSSLGAGHDGGRVVFEGLPADLVAARRTLTGQHLAEYVGTGVPTVDGQVVVG